MNKRLPRSRFKMGKIVLKLQNFFKPREIFIRGETMIERSQKMGVTLDQEYAAFLLEFQRNIPAAWGNYDLVFPGTKRKIGGYDRVTYLRQTCGCWRKGYGRVDFDWDRRACFVHLC